MIQKPSWKEVIRLLGGLCQNCGFRGVLTTHTMVRPKDVSSIDDAGASNELPKMKVCVTCRETPAGVLSDNQTHKRLPVGEYKK